MSRAELKQKGFTIIEVVLVLAIAALIFLMVFIALPALQRNQRDQARKTFQSKVSSAVTTHQSNKRGVSPATGEALSGYFDGVPATATAKSTDSTSRYIATGSDGFGENQYFVRVSPFPSGARTATGVAATDVVQVYTSAKCDTTGDQAIAGTNRQAAILMKMENGGSIVCQEV
jgi:prepilin-type N-terminal cleavage/methylation domain-containing protein